MSFWGELRRRNVVKVAVAYAIVGWLLVQVAATGLPIFEAPTWVIQVFTFFVLLGFPLALVLSWAYELTPEGVKRSEAVSAAESITTATGQKLNYVIIGLLTLAVVFLVIDNYVLERAGSGIAVQESTATGGYLPVAGVADKQPDVLPNSVAVLPFENLSLDPEDAFFAAGIHEEILNQLAKLSALNVIARTSVMQYAEGNKTIPEIAKELNVETVMEGSVRYSDDRVLVTAQLIDPATNSHLWSESYNREFSNIFEIQADIAMNVANALEAAFTSEEQQDIERAPTESTDAYELYLAALDEFHSGNVSAALEKVDAAVALDPSFARAWVLKAGIHTARAQGRDAAGFDADQDALLSAASRAIEIDPDLPSAQALSAAARGRRGEWIDAELAYRAAYDPPHPEVAASYGVHLLAVGNVAKAQELLSIARKNDPLNGITRGFYLLAVALLGDLQQAGEEYDKGSALYGDRWLGNWYITLARLGVGTPTSIDQIPPLQPLHDRARENMGSPETGIAMLREAYSNDGSGGDLLVIAVWGAYFGDPELAMGAMEELVRRNAENAFNFWIPAMRDVRQLPRFKTFIRDIGLVDYWDEFGWPTICRPLGDETFECD